MDAAISCLPPALLSTSFADAAIARALHLSSSSTSAMSSDSSSSSLSHSPLMLAALPSPACPYYAAPPPHAVCCDSVLVADSPPRHHRSSPTPGRQTNSHHPLGPAGPRAGKQNQKRRSRASKRAPTTYISTDAANFRLMVQNITGVQASDVDVVSGVEVAFLQATAALDAAALLGNPQLLPVPGDEASAGLRHHHQLHQLEQQQQQQPCFPTLDSWNVMYETNSAEML